MNRSDKQNRQPFNVTRKKNINYFYQVSPILTCISSSVISWKLSEPSNFSKSKTINKPDGRNDWLMILPYQTSKEEKEQQEREGSERVQELEEQLY